MPRASAPRAISSIGFCPSEYTVWQMDESPDIVPPHQVDREGAGERGLDLADILPQLGRDRRQPQTPDTRRPPPGHAAGASPGGGRRR